MYVRSRLLQLTPAKAIQRASNGNELIRQSPPALWGPPFLYQRLYGNLCASIELQLGRWGLRETGDV